MLKFQKGNTKLDNFPGDDIYTFSILSGWSCPFAKDCLSKAHRDSETGKRHIEDGSETKFRCFSASQEAFYTNTYNARKHNFDILRAAKTTDKMAQEIVRALPEKANIVRIHVAGDFFNQKYFDAWLHVANVNPNVKFYAYTKSLKYWVNRLDNIPTNLVLTASRGGRLDHMIDAYGLREARVVYSQAEADRLGLEIDKDESHAVVDGPSFALLLHGVQPAGTEAAKAWQKLRFQD